MGMKSVYWKRKNTVKIQSAETKFWLMLKAWIGLEMMKYEENYKYIQ
jgi:hypothetical protein